MRKALQLGAHGAFVILAGACSSGGGTSESTPLVFGQYSLATFYADEVDGPRSVALSTLFDGMGSAEVDQDLDGESEFLETTVSTDRTLKVADLPVRVMSRDGQILIGGLLEGDAAEFGISIAAGTKQALGVGESALVGRYSSCSIGCDPGALAFWTGLRSGVASGEGVVSLGALAHSDGAAGSLSLDCQIIDGQVDAADYSGAITFAGRTMTLCARDPAAPELLVVVRHGERMDESSLAGRYVGYLIERGFERTRTRRVELRADGDGGCMLTERESADSSRTAELAYTVSSDGACAVGDEWNGILGAQGEFLALVDTDATDGRIGFAVAMRTE